MGSPGRRGLGPRPGPRGFGAVWGRGRLGRPSSHRRGTTSPDPCVGSSRPLSHCIAYRDAIQSRSPQARGPERDPPRRTATLRRKWTRARHLMAQQHPSRIDRLILEDTPPPSPRATQASPTRPEVDLPFDWAVIPAITDQLNNPDPTLWDRLIDITAPTPVSYTHLRAHETDSYLVCRLLLEKKKNNSTPNTNN